VHVYFELDEFDRNLISIAVGFENGAPEICGQYYNLFHGWTMRMIDALNTERIEGLYHDLGALNEFSAFLGSVVARHFADIGISLECVRFSELNK
jgi:hypothetical protein